METAYYGSFNIWEKRFKDLERDIPKITPRMLSKELGIGIERYCKKNSS
jgi:hypothetical protein